MAVAPPPAPPPAPAPVPQPKPRVLRGNDNSAPAPAPAAAPAWSAPLTLPPPEALGVAAARPAMPAAADYAPPVDWNATHAHLRRLGAVGVQLARLPTGGYRFVFMLPTGQADLTRHVEGVGATEAEAVQRALVAAAEARP